MIIQIFRNRIYESRKFKYRIKKIESLIRSNLFQKEQDILGEITRSWKSNGTIALKPFNFGGTVFPLHVEFHQLMTHGSPFIKVKDKISTSYGEIEYETEYGDLAFVVEYWFKGKLINRKTSILQSKKEKSKNIVNIPLHQHYLMEFWPDVKFLSKIKTPIRYNFKDVRPDEFSFYHFILNHSVNPQFSSSICSAPFVGLKLGTKLQNIQKSLTLWCNLSKTNPNLKPPSQTLSMPLLPGGIYQHGKYYKWNLIPKPFSRFMLDAAYLHVGSDNKSVFELARERVPHILYMKVVGGKEEREFRGD